jgi:hypothetical protein
MNYSNARTMAASIGFCGLVLTLVTLKVTRRTDAWRSL